MTVGNVFFVVASVIALFGAIMTIASRSPIRSAVGLLITIVGIAALFLMLNAQFLAAIQLIVYAGAIVVLFIFVIMLLGPSATAPSDRRGELARTIGGGVFGLAGLGAIYLLVRTAPPRPKGLLMNIPDAFGTVDSFGDILFKD